MITSLLCAAFFPAAQGQGRYSDWWHFGKQAGVHFSPSGPIAFYDSQLFSTEASASISDSLGNLLFYTNGYYIWNKNNEKMPHGDSLHGDQPYDPWTTSQWADSVGNSSTNGVIIVPRPGYPKEYFVFTHVMACTNPACNDGIVYQRVDMTAEGGLGDVVERNVWLEYDQRKYTEKLAATRHANGRDWWLIAREAGNANFVKWLVTPTGIEGPFLQSIGTVHEWGGQGVFGEICFNRKGDKLGLVNVNGLVELFDFDRCTGEFSNTITLNASLGGAYQQSYFYGCAFAPMRPLFYSASCDSIYQWDLMDENNIVKTALWKNPRPYNPNAPMGGDTVYVLGQMELGPDDKIYLKLGQPVYFTDPADSNMTSLAVINSPNTSGIGCDFQLNAVSFAPRIGWYGLPNLPNYNLGAIYQSPCDTLGLGKPEDTTDIVPVIGSEVQFAVYPNPGFDYFHCTYHLTSSHQAVVEVFDALGRKHISVPAQHGSTRVSTKALPPGFYTVQLKVSGHPAAVSKWIKVG